MAEFEQTLEEVCAMVASGAIMNNDRLARLARAFSEVSRPVISRLRRCDELLQKGLRSEALHLARTEPDLIEAVERLEFPNRDVWDNAIGIYGLVAAPRPSSSSAAALHRAFAEEEPLRPLLIRHRLLALARAPQIERLNNLRKLVQQDPGNLAFQDDLAQFEQGRIKAMKLEFTNARASKNIDAMIRILDEVENSPWVNPPSDSLVRDIKVLAGKAKKDKLALNASRIAIRIQTAMAATDVAECRRLMGEYASIALEFGADDPIKPNSAIEFADDWLRKLDDAKANESELRLLSSDIVEALSRHDLTEAQLNFLLDQAQQLGRLDPQLLAACTNRMDHFLALRKKREVIILALSLAAGAMCLIIFLILVMRRL